MRIHDQLHPQAEASAREVHDEQRPGELHHPPGDHQQGHPGDAALHCLRVRSVHLRARGAASYLQIGEGLELRLRKLTLYFWTFKEKIRFRFNFVNKKHKEK